MHYLYTITNGKNGKVYVGQSIEPKQRWNAHKNLAKNPERSGQYIHRAMNKYSTDNFSFEIIACCKTQDDANVIEDILIIQYDSRNHNKGYNLQPGGKTVSGSDHPCFGISLSEERKQHLRDIYSVPENHPQYGMPKSEETRQKIADSLNGNIPWNKGMKTAKISIKKPRKIRVQTLQEIAKRAASLLKLTDQQVEVIKNDPRSARKIAADYNITHTTVLRVKRGNY